MERRPRWTFWNQRYNATLGEIARECVDAAVFGTHNNFDVIIDRGILEPCYWRDCQGGPEEDLVLVRKYERDGVKSYGFHQSCFKELLLSDLQTHDCSNRFYRPN